MQFMNKTKSKSNDKFIINNISFKNKIKFFRYKALENVQGNKQFSVLSSFQRFTPNSVFYPHFSVLSPFQCFIPISAFYRNFSVLSPFQRFIPISAFYPHFSFRNSVSAFYPDPIIRESLHIRGGRSAAEGEAYLFLCFVNQ